MDPFAVHVHFVDLLKKLNATQASIQKVVGFALKHYPECGEDLWDCIVSDCNQASTNMRINLLYLLDSLCEFSAQTASKDRSRAAKQSAGNYYIKYISRDLEKIVESVVPDNRDGLMNIQSTAQLLDTWRTKRILDQKVVEAAISALDRRRTSIQTTILQQPSDVKITREFTSHSQVVKRIEEDRERHKILRERRWVQLIDRSENIQPTLTVFLPHSLPSTRSKSDVIGDGMEVDDTEETGAGTRVEAPPLAIDIEFENAWETTSDWNEDDVDAIAEESRLCFPEPASAVVEPGK